MTTPHLQCIAVGHFRWKHHTHLTLAFLRPDMYAASVRTALPALQYLGC
jgi:hypothetical protein